jgi:hypothetical protein
LLPRGAPNTYCAFGRSSLAPTQIPVVGHPPLAGPPYWISCRTICRWVHQGWRLVTLTAIPSKSRAVRAPIRQASFMPRPASSVEKSRGVEGRGVSCARTRGAGLARSDGAGLARLVGLAGLLGQVFMVFWGVHVPRLRLCMPSPPHLSPGRGKSVVPSEATPTRRRPGVGCPSDA